MVGTAGTVGVSIAWFMEPMSRGACVVRCIRALLLRPVCGHQLAMLGARNFGAACYGPGAFLNARTVRTGSVRLNLSMTGCHSGGSAFRL
jgi:hypothetical protein